MKQFQHTHLMLTAVSIPVAILVCWLVYKKTASKKEKDSEDTSEITDSIKKESDSKKDAQSNIRESKKVVEFSETETMCFFEKPIESLNENENSLLNHCNVQESYPDKLCNGGIPVISAGNDFNKKDIIDNQSAQEVLMSTDAPPSANDSAHEHDITSMHNESLLNSAESDNASKQFASLNELSVSDNGDASSMDVKSASEQFASLNELSKSHVSDNGDASSMDVKSLSSLESETSCRSRDSQLEEDLSTDIIQENSDVLTNNIERSVTEKISQQLETNNFATVNSQTHSSSEKTLHDKADVENDSNTNNNNSITGAPMTNGQNSISPCVSSPCSETSGQLCDSCGMNKNGSPLNSDHGEQNGWDEKNLNKSDEEIAQQEEKALSKKRPNTLNRLDSRTNGESAMQVHVEFPSDKVGLLIGRQGRNIKQLKQDSGADVYVHTAKFRDDIQVLQICGTQSEIESCVSRIKRRFNDVTLSPFDPADICSSPPSSSSGVSPNPNSSPPLLFSMPNISQLRLPEGHTVDVLVSAIAAVDCIFLQQHTHPTYLSLEGLERAMEHCYAEPSTPSLPKPVQAGLICAAPQQGMWYRAQVIQPYEESDEVLIKFMDYGGYATVSDKCIKQIRADFVTLPFQAIECYLDNIAPPEDNKFCEETVAKIADLLKEGRYQARITGYRSDGHPKIHLYKCHNNEVALVNQAIVTKGLATWVEPAPYH